MFKWLDKRRERKLLQWIAKHDIKKEKYKFLFMSEEGDKLIEADFTGVDNYLYGFIEQGGVLIYAYDKEVYQKIKTCKKQHISYCFTENEHETKLNDLIEKKKYQPITYFYTEDGNMIYVNAVRYLPYPIFRDMKEELKKEIFDILFDKSYHYIWVGSDRLEEEIEECKRKSIKYRFTIQKNLIKELYGK